MPTTPRTPAMQRFHNTLSLVEAEVIELRENKLQEEDTVQKLKEEMKQFREESRASIAKLESRMDKLSQTNDDLRYHLSTTGEELEQRERYIDTLNQQLVIMSSASREHVHQLGPSQHSSTRPHHNTALLDPAHHNTALLDRPITTQLY
ncbi:unnamed protein product [Coregonus sp. 'balchen']|nr:unnamed protein product [Coregonus sp. 'balchen']